MKGIQEYDESIGKWVWCPGYVALDEATAKEKLKLLRKWAKDDDSSKHYRISNGQIVPK